jgi:hypothetical protein
MGALMGMKWPRIKEETLSEIESRMPQFLFYRRIDKKRKLCQCSACGNSGVEEISGKSGEVPKGHDGTAGQRGKPAERINHEFAPRPGTLFYKGRCKCTSSILDIWEGSPGRGTKI